MRDCPSRTWPRPSSPSSAAPSIVGAKAIPQGYIEIYAPEVTYFDPVQERRIDGLDALKNNARALTPVKSASIVSTWSPLRVQRHGEIAVLTFNLMSHRTQPDGKDAIIAHWNATAVYRAMEGTWKSIHVHWSYIKPELKTPISETVS